MKNSLPQAAVQPHIVIVCFGFAADCMRRQPWHMAHGLASGFERLGYRVSLVTDAARPQVSAPYGILRVTRLFRRGRPTSELRALVDHLAPQKVFVFTGALQLIRQRRIDWRAPTALVIASPRLKLKEIASLGAAALWHERDLLALPLINALLPGFLLRAGYDRSRATELVFLSRAAQERFHELGLPWGRRLRPQIAQSALAATPVPAGEPRIVYLGPPLAARGAWLALEAFEQAVALGLRGRLLLLIRPDVRPAAMERFVQRVEKSPYRAHIDLVVGMLPPAELEAKLAECHLFLLPFGAPVSEVPLVILEAGMSGRQIVTLDAPGVSEFALELGGVVAASPAELPHALLHALRRPRPEPADPARWTRWDKAVAGLADAPNRQIHDWRLIALCGVDGAGKSFLLERLSQRLKAERVEHRHVWTRFRNYLSKPLLALARLTGHNRKEVTDGTLVGYHDFQSAPWLALPFLWLQVIDNVLDIILRYHLGRRRLVIGDRCVFDTLVDLAVDTGRDRLVIEKIGPWLVRLLPAPRLVVVITRPVALVRQSRPDALADRHFARRRMLYQRLAATFDLPVIDNDNLPETAVEDILCLARGGGEQVEPTP